MHTTQNIDWSDADSAAKLVAGNWQRFSSFAWMRGYKLEDADNWIVWYTSNRDSGLLAQSNEQAINKRLQPFSEGDNPDLVFERHDHWAVGYVEGFSIRAFSSNGAVSPAFREFCRIQEELDNYPILDESDYSEREYHATLENYLNELWRLKDDLPEGWEGEVYGWFDQNGKSQFTENRDDQGGYAPEEEIIKALKDLGLMPTVVVKS
jgi:hypothetical protein